MKLTLYSFSVKRLNLYFVGIALIFFEFSFLIFPILRGEFPKLGITLSTLSEFSFYQFQFIEQNRIASVASIFFCYIATLAIASARLNTLLNLLFILNILVTVLGIGIPLYLFRPYGNT